MAQLQGPQYEITPDPKEPSATLDPLFILDGYKTRSFSDASIDSSAPYVLNEESEVSSVMVGGKPSVPHGFVDVSIGASYSLDKHLDVQMDLSVPSPGLWATLPGGGELLNFERDICTIDLELDRPTLSIGLSS